MSNPKSKGNQSLEEFRVELTSTALVTQVQHVKAKSPEDAERIAKNKANDNVWQYQGLINDSDINVASVR